MLSTVWAGTVDILSFSIAYSLQITVKPNVKRLPFVYRLKASLKGLSEFFLGWLHTYWDVSRTSIMSCAKHISSVPTNAGSCGEDT